MQGLAAIIGGAVILVAIIISVVALIPVALAYVALRVQDARQPEPDPKLGLKTAFHAVHTVAILIILFGLTVFMVDTLSGTIAPGRQNFPRAQRPAGPNEMQRVAVGLVASGTLFALGFWAFLLRTNDATRRSVRRVFVGGRLALCLLITMMSVTGLFINLLQTNADAEVTESLLALLLVWAPASLIHLLLFSVATATHSAKRARRSRDDDEEEEERGWHPPPG